MKKKVDFKIDFIGIGAERSGTTWIYDCLNEHPEVCMASQKEIYYFNRLDRHFLKIENKRYKRGLGWYMSFFNHCGEKSIKGEFTPTYMFCPHSVARIKEHFPEVKLIAILRNPVDRAFSQYLSNKRSGLIPDVSFEKALKIMDSYVEKGYYYKHLIRYFKLFPRKRIRIFLTEDMADRPRWVVKSLYKFLGLKDINFVPHSIYRKSNVSMVSRWFALNSFLINIEIFLKRQKLDIILRFLEEVGIRKLAYDINHFVNVKPLEEYPKVRKTTRKRLTKVFKKDIQSLEKLIKRDLRAWY